MVEEIEGALKALKLGKSWGNDSLDPEHIYFGGDTLKLLLKKIFNTIVSLEELPASLNEGLIIPVHKGKGKDPFLPGSYRGITLSSVISKLFEIILLKRLSPVLEDAGVPDLAQTHTKEASPVPMQSLPHKKHCSLMFEMGASHFFASMTLRRPSTRSNCLF